MRTAIFWLASAAGVSIFSDQPGPPFAAGTHFNPPKSIPGIFRALCACAVEAVPYPTPPCAAPLKSAAPVPWNAALWHGGHELLRVAHW